MDNADAHGEVNKRRLEQWIAAYSDALLRMCYVCLRDRAQAEDATQDTFLKAWRHMDAFVNREGGSEKAWLMRIAVNTCRDYRRSAWFRHIDRTRDLENLPPKSASQPEESALLNDVYELPQKLKQAILLYYYQEMTLEETASALGVSRSAVCKRLNKARALLKGRLTGRDDDE